jgi:hypothetical protein
MASSVAVSTALSGSSNRSMRGSRTNARANADALFLATAQGDATFAQQSLIAFRKAFDVAGVPVRSSLRRWHDLRSVVKDPG